MRISDEGQYMIKCFYAEQIHHSSHYGVNKDGTSRHKIKILETSLTLDSGEILPLGLHGPCVVRLSPLFYREPY